jgi:hypothetical protein
MAAHGNCSGFLMFMHGCFAVNISTGMELSFVYKVNFIQNVYTILN